MTHKLPSEKSNNYLRNTMSKTTYSVKDLDTLISEANDKSIKIINDFSEYLNQTGLVKKTIKNHVNNLSFFAKYLNHYVNSDDQLKIISQADGGDLSSFSTSFFPDKVVWASPSSAKQNITSFKKFFSWLYENKQISPDHYQDIINTIKEEKSDWIHCAGCDDSYW